MTDHSVSDAARLLGVSVPRVHQRIRDGSLDARRVGHQWVIPSRGLQRVRNPLTGRPFSARSAWSMIATSVSDSDRAPASSRDWAQGYLAARASKERTRARDRLLVLLADAGRAASDAAAAELGARLRHAMGRRASRAALWAAATDLSDLRGDERVVLAGLSTPGVGLASGDVVELYVAGEDVDQMVQDYLLERRSDANVFLHTVDRQASLDPPRDVFTSSILLAADLAEHRRPREEHRAFEILAEVARTRDDG